MDRAVIFLVVAFLVLSTPVGLSGQARGSAGDTSRMPPSATVHPEARRAISLLRSPFCPGLMLEVCPSPDAAILRDSIDALARSGLSADSIVERVIAEHGEEWRAMPRREGTGWWAWLMPPLVLALGAAAVAAILARRSRVRTVDRSGRDGAEEDPRLQRALEELDHSERPEW